MADGWFITEVAVVTLVTLGTFPDHDSYRGVHLVSAAATTLTWYFVFALLICYHRGVTLPERGRVV